MRRVLVAMALTCAIAAPAAAQGTPVQPSVITFGSALADMSTKLDGRCVTANVRAIPVFRVLQGLTEAQHQIDCEGFQFEGAPRHAEFVFSDAGLEMVWIMIDARDSAAVSQRMRADYGTSDMQNAKFSAWTTNRAALRSDVPEVLFYSRRLAARIAEWFGPKSTF